MIARWLRYLLVAAAAGFGALHWLIVELDAFGFVHVLTAMASGAVAMLTTAVGALVVSDWQADVQSSQEWARLGLTPVHISRPLELACESDVDPRYLAPASDEALQRVLLVYRAAVPPTCSAPDLERSPDLPPAQAVPNPISGAAVVSKAASPERALSNVVGTRASTAKTSSRRGRSREKVRAARVRLVANGNAWPLWTTRLSPTTEKAAEVIVLSTRQDDRAPCQPEGSIGHDEADSAAQPACRDLLQVVARWSDPAEAAARQQRDGSADTSPDTIIVSDDLGPQIPIGAAELEVIETYLGHLLDELLAPSRTRPEPDQT